MRDRPGLRERIAAMSRNRGRKLVAANTDHARDRSLCVQRVYDRIAAWNEKGSWRGGWDSNRQLQGTLFEMATAYLFHLARNHPFEDGNKRTALMCALVFLGLNGHRLEAEPETLYELVDGVAARTIDKAEVAVFLRQGSVSR